MNVSICFCKQTAQNEHTSTIATFERDIVFQSNRYPNNASPNTSDLPPVCERVWSGEIALNFPNLWSSRKTLPSQTHTHTHTSGSTLSILSYVYTTHTHTHTHPPDGTHNSGSQFRQPLVLILLCVIAIVIRVCMCVCAHSRWANCRSVLSFHVYKEDT